MLIFPLFRPGFPSCSGNRQSLGHIDSHQCFLCTFLPCLGPSCFQPEHRGALKGGKGRDGRPRITCRIRGQEPDRQWYLHPPWEGWSGNGAPPSFFTVPCKDSAPQANLLSRLQPPVSVWPDGTADRRGAQRWVFMGSVMSIQQGLDPAPLDVSGTGSGSVLAREMGGKEYPICNRTLDQRVTLGGSVNQ